MKAAVVVSGGKLEIWDVPAPKPGEYEVLCRIEYGTTCAGTDIRLMAGKHPNPVAFPTILGHESVGRVVEIGKRVRNFKVGDLISRIGAPAGLIDGLHANWGGFAQYGIARDHWQMRKDGLPAEQWNRFRVNQIIPDTIEDRAAPMIITWRETHSYVNRLGVARGHKVLVIGSGANALAIAAHACNKGAAVTQIGSLSRKDFSVPVGVEHYIDYKAPDIFEQVLDADAGSYDFMIDGVGASHTLNAVLPALKPHGVVAVYGWNERSDYGIDPFRATSSFRIYADGYDEEETHGEVISEILSGRLNAQNWVDLDRPVPIEEISSAYSRLAHHEALKLLITL